MEKDGVFKFSEPFRIDPDKLTDEHRTWLPKFQGSEQGKAIPVSNTITSTTSATQDLEVFKNYPSDKNNKLLKKKYGNKEANFLDYEKNLFQKVTEEEQQAGDPYAKTLSFEEVLGSSFDSNLPVTKISEETAKRFDPYGLKAQADYSDPNAHVMSQADSNAIMNQAGAGTPKDYHYYGQTGGLKPESGIDTIKPKDYHYYGQTGGLKPESGIDTIKPKDYHYYGQTGGLKPTESKSIVPPEITGGGQQKAIEDILKENELDALNKKHIADMKENELDALNKKHIADMKKDKGISAIESPDDVSVSSEGRLEELKKKILNKEEHRLPVSGDMPKWVQAMRLTLPLDELDEFMELIGAGVSGEDAHEIRKKKKILGKEFGLSTGDLLMWDAKQTGKSFKEVKEQIDDGKKRAKVMGLGVDQLVGPSNTEWDEIKKREEILKNEGQSGLDEYMLDLAKKEDAAKNKEKKSVSDTLIDSDYKMTEKDGILQIPKVDVEQHEIKDLSKRSEAIDQYYLEKKLKQAETKEGLGEGDQNALKTGLKGEGVKTAGLTDKNMLLIAMGLGMMASQKPGLTGAGEGALTGLKTVAPLLTKKASDFQIVEVADKDNPGQTKLVKINKRTNEVTDLGVGGKSKKTEKQKGYEWMSTVTGKPVKNLVMRDLELKDKKKSKRERIEAMAKYVWGQDILGGTQADVAGYIEQATKMIEAIDKIPNADLDDILGL